MFKKLTGQGAAMRATGQPGNRINRRLVMTYRKKFISLAIVLASVVFAALTFVDRSRAQQGRPHGQIQEQTQEQSINEQLHRACRNRADCPTSGCSKTSRG
jgi:hypothetical protein